MVCFVLLFFNHTISFPCNCVVLSYAFADKYFSFVYLFAPLDGFFGNCLCCLSFEAEIGCVFIELIGILVLFSLT